MLRKPHPEGLIGAVRVELRGRRDGQSDSLVLGALDKPAVATGAIAALALRCATTGRMPAGAAGLAAVPDTTAFLSDLVHVGIKGALFEGSS
jgi:hypothetical protein